MVRESPPYQSRLSFEPSMVAAMSAGKLSATATKAKAKTSIITISPFVWRKAPCSEAGTMPRPGSDRCDGHHEIGDCDVARAPRADLHQRDIGNKNEAFSRARECYEKASACYKRRKQVDNRKHSIGFILPHRANPDGLNFRKRQASASMIIVELNLGRVAGCLAIDAIRALAQQVAGEQPLPVVAGDDFPRRRPPLRYD